MPRNKTATWADNTIPRIDHGAGKALGTDQPMLQPSGVVIGDDGSIHLGDNVNIHLGASDDTDISYSSALGALIIGAPTPRMQFFKTGNPIIKFIGTTYIDQNLGSGAVTVLTLDQGDNDETFLDFVGVSASDGSRSISSDTTEDSAKIGAVRVDINGVLGWVRIHADES